MIWIYDLYLYRSAEIFVILRFCCVSYFVYLRERCGRWANLYFGARQRTLSANHKYFETVAARPAPCE